jgi:hypothetical protein
MEILFLYGVCIFFFMSIDQSLTVTTSSAGREIANATPCRLANRHKDCFRLEDNSTKSTSRQPSLSAKTSKPKSAP